MLESLSLDKIFDAAHSLIVSALHAALSVVGISEAVDAYRHRAHAGVFEHFRNIFGNESCIRGHAPVKTLVNCIAQKLSKIRIKKGLSARNAELDFLQIEVLLNISQYGFEGLFIGSVSQSGRTGGTAMETLLIAAPCQLEKQVDKIGLLKQFCPEFSLPVEVRYLGFFYVH